MTKETSTTVWKSEEGECTITIVVDGEIKRGDLEIQVEATIIGLGYLPKEEDEK